MRKRKNLNWKQIVFHLLGMLFFALAFQHFAYLTNLNLSELIRLSGSVERVSTSNEATPSTLTELWISIEFGRTIGSVLGLVLSLIISARRKWYWINSVISFLIILLLGFWIFKNSAFLFPVSFLPGASYYIVIGCLFLAIGVLFLLLKRPVEMKKDRSIRERGYA